MKKTLLVGAGAALLAGSLMAQNALTVNGACAQEGSFGMEISMDGSTNETYVQAGASVGFNNETVLRSSIWVNFDNHNGLHGIRDFAVAGFGASGSRPFRLMSLNNENNNKEQVRLICQSNCAGGPSSACPFRGTNTIDLDPGWNNIVIEWTQGDAAPAPANSVCQATNVTNGQVAQLASPIRMAQYDIRQVRVGRTGAGNFNASASGTKCFDDAQFFRTLAP